VEDESVVVCGPTSYFGDDVKTKCALCGAEVFHRPHVPDGKRVCCACVVKEMGSGTQWAIAITAEAARAAIEYLRAERANRTEAGN